MENINEVGESNNVNKKVIVTNVCDLAYLTEIMGGKKNLIKDIIDLFIEQTPGELLSISDAIRNSDNEIVERMAHKMKSSVSIIGIDSLKPVLNEMEDLAETRLNFSRIKELNFELERICNKAIGEMKAATLNYA